jgi:hypothetical protein
MIVMGCPSIITTTIILKHRNMCGFAWNKTFAKININVE